MYKNEVKEITFNTKYVTGQSLEVLTTFDKNKYIVKGSTGIGGTTAILNTTKGNRLIISPNTGMIKGKELKRNEFASHKQAFIFSKSSDNWELVQQYLANSDTQNLIINTTPEQIIRLYTTNKTLYNLIITLPVFIDEIHSYSVDNSYRESVGAFMELVYNEWQSNFILSTATPIKNFIDIPKGIDIEYLKVTRDNEPIKQLHYSTSAKDITNFIEIENSKGNLVVLFTNDKNHHISNKTKRVKNLVGNNLNVKIAPYERDNNINDSNLFDCDLLVCSSAYFAGFDIPVNCSICVISDQSNDAYKVCVNNVVQAYGRCRATVLNALFVNKKSKINNQYPTSTNELNDYYKQYIKSIEYFTEELINKEHYYQVENHKPSISKQMFVNRGALVCNAINKLHDYQLYNDEILNDVFKSYNFELVDYAPITHEKKIISNYPFKERLTNLMQLQSNELSQSFKTIKKNFKSKGNGAFSSSLAIEYLTAYLIKVGEMHTLKDKLNNKRLRVNEFYKSVNNHLRVNSETAHLNEQLSKAQFTKAIELYGNNPIDESLQALINDWHYLYSIYKVKNKMFNEQTTREINKYEQFHNSELYTSLYLNKKHRVRNARTSIINACSNLNIYLTDKELSKLNECIKTAYKKLDKSGTHTNYHTTKHNINKMVDIIGYLFTNGGVNYSVNEKKDRIYNPITSLPSGLRHIVPIKFIEIDITGANPQIVDRILKTQIGLNVYENLMTKLSITRDEAKIRYNTFLNNHNAAIKTATKFYLSCGYPTDKAEQLASLTAQVSKGSFYEIMTQNEATIIFAYEQFLTDKNINSFRFHDAVIIQQTDAINVHLPTQMKGYEFHLSYFNNDNKYKNNIKKNDLNIMHNEQPKQINGESIMLDLCTDAEEWQPREPIKIISLGNDEDYKRLKLKYGNIVVNGW